jgi:hypothetical protein
MVSRIVDACVYRTFYNIGIVSLLIMLSTPFIFYFPLNQTIISGIFISNIMQKEAVDGAV